MLDTTTPGDAAPPDDGRQAAPAPERRPADEARHAPGGERPAPDEEPRGCLFALSQPPLMIFLTVVGTLILLASLHDLLLL
ncbi:hypothetical protein [Streptomyces alboniger]|uniref:Uncharacterized protein n=1 Tax=Streptomyces alboniger TaxID=132473 RepID=A0A5J6HBT3_STRAD|nr:hypothetical protein [Streptomyces alboniger]QEV17078.1 hypothetical protein CP975_05810 [Streptomyces alboniger]